MSRISYPILPILLALLWSCQGEQAPVVEPIVVPDSPAERGVATGIRTVYAPGLALEIFYPASEDSTVSGPAEAIDIRDFVSDEVTALLGSVDLPLMPLQARRGVPLRNVDGKLPVVFFSHGFAAFRTQSPDLCDHLASRGYVVVAVDHPGRMLTDLLPCLFSPALSGCDLAGFGEDNSPRHIRDAVAWLEAEVADEESFLFDAVDVGTRGIVGHSAGGGTAASMTDGDGFQAQVSMAAGPAMNSSSPSLFISGVCDAIVTDAQVQEGWLASPNADLLRMHGAGHLPFSDLCELDLATFTEEVLAPRDDINGLFLGQLEALGSDGCPGVRPTLDECGEEFASLEEAQRVIRHYTTSYLDSLLRDGSSLELMTDAPDAEWVGRAP